MRQRAPMRRTLGLGVLALSACRRADRLPQEPIGHWAGWIRSSLTIAQAEVLLLESYPVQVALRVRGERGSPCAQPIWEVGVDDEAERIEIELHAWSDPVMDCIPVVRPFEVRIPLGSYTQAPASVVLNGKPVAQLSLPQVASASRGSRPQPRALGRRPGYGRALRMSRRSRHVLEASLHHQKRCVLCIGDGASAIG